MKERNIFLSLQRIISRF